MQSIRMGLGAKSTGNGKPVRTRVKRKLNARVSSRIKSAKMRRSLRKTFFEKLLTVY